MGVGAVALGCCWTSLLALRLVRCKARSRCFSKVCARLWTSGGSGRVPESCGAGVLLLGEPGMAARAMSRGGVGAGVTVPADWGTATGGSADTAGAAESVNPSASPAGLPAAAAKIAVSIGG